MSSNDLKPDKTPWKSTSNEKESKALADAILEAISNNGWRICLAYPINVDIHGLECERIYLSVRCRVFKEEELTNDTSKREQAG